MTFADEIEKIASTRFSLVRLEPARQINEIWTPIGGGLYEYAFTEVVSRILENGNALTKSSGVLSSGQWNQDDVTKKVTIYPSDPNATSVMFYYLFYTSDYDRLYPIDVTSGDTVCWNGRILSDPSVTQSINNLANSFTLTTSTSNVTFENSDSKFQDYLTDNDSFANKNAASWVVVNSEIKKIFTGKIMGASLGENDFSVKLNDALSIAINETPYLGDTLDQSIANDITYPDIYGPDKNRVIPVIFGRSTQNQIVSGSSPHSIISDETKYTAINTDTTTNGKNWALCRIPISVSLNSSTPTGASFPQDVTAYNFNILQPSSTFLGAFTFGSSGIIFTGDKTDEIEIGDTFTYTTGDGTFNAVVTGAVYSSGPNTTTMRFVSDQTVETDAGFARITVTSISFTGIPCVMIKTRAKQTTSGTTGDNNDDPIPYFLAIPGKHYTTSVTNLTNTKLVSITFLSGWEDTVFHADRILNASSATFDNTIDQFFLPYDNAEADHNQNKIIYKIRTDEAMSNHSDVLKYILESSEIETDAVSFAEAKSGFDADVQFSIPYIGQRTPEPLNTYIGSLLESTIGAIYSDIDGVVKYKLFDLPSVGDVIDENTYLKGSMSISLTYRDIVTRIIWSNDHEPEPGFYSIYNCSASEENDDARQLHETVKTSFIKHVLKDITIDDRYKKLLSLRSERFVNYKYTTAASSLLNDILDNINISDPRVLGGSGSVDTKITAITKDDDTVTITVSDLLGL